MQKTYLLRPEVTFLFDHFGENERVVDFELYHTPLRQFRLDMNEHLPRAITPTIETHPGKAILLRFGSSHSCWLLAANEDLWLIPHRVQQNLRRKSVRALLAEFRNRRSRLGTKRKWVRSMPYLNTDNYFRFLLVCRELCRRGIAVPKVSK